MSDVYKEYMVKRETSSAGTVLKVVCIIIAVLAFLTSSIVGLVVAVLLVGGAYYLHLNSQLEFEYLYVDKELSIDKIMARSKRKHVHTVAVDEMEIVAPLGSYHLDAFKQKDTTYKTFDYSSKVKNAKDTTYVIYCKNMKKVIIEADEEFIKAIYTNAPRTVFVN